MKICFIITGLSVGGAEMMLYKLLQHSPSLRHGLVVSLAPGGDMADQIRKFGVRVESLGMRPGIPDMFSLWRLIRLLRVEQFDAVSTWMYHADFFGGIAAKIAGIPVLWNIRNSNLDPGKTKLTTRLLVRMCGKLSEVIPQRIISCSAVAQNIHVRLGYSREKFIIIPNGFDLQGFKPDYTARESVKNELGLQAGALLVGLVARFDPQKNHLGFLEATRQIIASQPAARFVLVGAGVTGENELIREKIEELNLGSYVLLLGPRTDIARLMAAFDIVVSSSSYGEAFPNVLGEAMACGVPCVTTDAGDSAYIVADTGKIVPVGDMRALACGVLELLALPAKEREALGRQARARVEELFEIGHIARTYEQTFEEVRRACAV